MPWQRSLEIIEKKTENEKAKVSELMAEAKGYKQPYIPGITTFKIQSRDLKGQELSADGSHRRPIKEGITLVNITHNRGVYMSTLPTKYFLLFTFLKYGWITFPHPIDITHAHCFSQKKYK